MSLTISKVTRTFAMGSVTLADPDPSWTPDQVRMAYADAYPHLAACVVGEPKITGETVSYEFKAPEARTKG